MRTPPPSWIRNTVAISCDNKLLSLEVLTNLTGQYNEMLWYLLEGKDEGKSMADQPVRAIIFQYPVSTESVASSTKNLEELMVDINYLFSGDVCHELS